MKLLDLRARQGRPLKQNSVTVRRKVVDLNGHVARISRHLHDGTRDSHLILGHALVISKGFSFCLQPKAHNHCSARRLHLLEHATVNNQRWVFAIWKKNQLPTALPI